METLNDIIVESARRFGDRPALLIKPGFRTRIWSYADLADIVPRVARHLAEAGIAKGDRVLVWGPNRPEWGIAFLALLRLGAVAVPIDLGSLADLAARIAERTRAVAVVAAPPALERARTLGLRVHEMTALPDLARTKEPLAPAAVRSIDLAEIVFTSGTTGDPKGAMLTHGNILANALAARQIFPIGPQHRMLSILPLSHMFEQLAGFALVLLAGASVVYPTSRQPAVLRRTFKEFRVTMVLITPAVVRSLFAAIERRAEQEGKGALFARLRRYARRLPFRLRRVLFGTVHRQFGGRLRYIVSGGAALDPAVGNAWGDLGVDVLQGYGTTECAPAITFNRLDKNRMGTVGVPLPGVEVRIAEDGEVVVRGPNVFPGYWENEEATAACLDGDGSYHTGDLGELDRDGFLTLRGRKKDLIVLADGTNVYPEDVENVLAADPRVRDATVVGFQRPAEEVRVHAVFLTDRPDVVPAVVRDANAKLGSHQQIRGQSVWPEEDFPRTPTLKVKKRFVVEWLRSAERTAAVAHDAVAPGKPLTEVEAIVARLAKVPPDALRPNARLSSDLGLDSLGRVELLGVIEEELGAYIDDAALEPDATVGALERMVEAAREAKRDSGIFGWPLNPAVRSFGLLVQQTLVWPLVHLFYRVRVRGRENLAGLRGPVLFAPNHCLHWDNGIILTAIPLGWRWRLAIAAAADDVFGSRIRGFGSALFANAFPLAREGAIRRSLELLGARLDRRFSVLIYPEGKLTVGGPMQPFKSGTGLIAVEGATPVIPVKLRINRMSGILDRRGMPLRGDVEVVFGAPLYFAGGTPPGDATARLEAAVAAL